MTTLPNLYPISGIEESFKSIQSKLSKGTYSIFQYRKKEREVFDKLEALLAHAMLSIPATKGFEIGIGSIVRLVVPEDELANNNHRVASKKISISDKGTTCTLSLNRRPVEVADYISSS